MNDNIGIVFLTNGRFSEVTINVQFLNFNVEKLGFLYLLIVQINS